METNNNKSIELERAVLGCILIQKDAIKRVIDILTDDCFTFSWHKSIWRIAKKLNAQGEEIDSLSICECMPGSYALCSYVRNLTKEVASTAHLEIFSKRLKALADARSKAERKDDSRVVHPIDSEDSRDSEIELLREENRRLVNQVEDFRSKLYVAEKEAKIYKETGCNVLGELVSATTVINCLERKLPFFSKRILHRLRTKYKV